MTSPRRSRNFRFRSTSTANGISVAGITMGPEVWTYSEDGSSEGRILGVVNRRGAISFSEPDEASAIAVHAVGSLADTPQEDVPEDVAGFLRERRVELLVTNPRSVTQSGLPAQRFRLAMRDGDAPSDLWTVAGGIAYKPLDRAPMEVVAVLSSQGLVLVWTEWQPAHEQAALVAFDAALEKVRIS